MNEILNKIKTRLPDANLVLQSVYPYTTDKNDRIIDLNNYYAFEFHRYKGFWTLDEY